MPEDRTPSCIFAMEREYTSVIICLNIMIKIKRGVEILQGGLNGNRERNKSITH